MHSVRLKLVCEPKIRIPDICTAGSFSPMRDMAIGIALSAGIVAIATKSAAVALIEGSRFFVSRISKSNIPAVLGLSLRNTSRYLPRFSVVVDEAAEISFSTRLTDGDSISARVDKITNATSGSLSLAILVTSEDSF